MLKAGRQRQTLSSASGVLSPWLRWLINQMTPSDVDLFASLTNLTQRFGLDYGLLHTCTLDHPNALNNYKARGLEVFKVETQEEGMA